MSLVDLRSVFVALNRPLLAMLTFHQEPAWLGAACLVLLGAALGAAGAFFLLWPTASGDRWPGARRHWARRHAAGADPADPRQQPGHQALHDLLYTWSGSSARRGDHLPGDRCRVLLWQINRQRIETALAGLDRDRRRIRWGYLGAAALLVALFPMFAGNFIGQVLLVVGLFTLMGMGLNLEVGLAGLLDLGFVAFYAVGAYTTALLMADSPYALAHLSFWVAMPIAVLVSLIVGVLFGIPVLKIRGDYLAVATLALGEIVRVIVLSDAAAPLLGGAAILQIPRPEIGSFVLAPRCRCST